MIIEGAISVKAAISNKKREVKKVYIDKNKKTKDFNYIRKIAKENGIGLIEMPKEYLINLAKGKTFGGILADVSLRKYDELTDGDVFYLDGIEDPFNLGYIFRNGACYGFDFRHIFDWKLH